MGKHAVFNFSLFFIYIAVMTALMIWQGIGIAPDRYAFILLFLSFFIKRTRAFLLDWSPFLFILISYDFLRGLADSLNTNVNYYFPINFGFSFFSDSLPLGVVLQQKFFNPNNLKWYDYSATILYFLHFALPLTFGFYLWLKNRQYFKQFILGLLILSYSAWITYVIFPVAPPWLANKQGYITGISKIMDYTLNAFPEKLSLPTIYHQINPNEVAAIPSMHAAYPFLILLYMVKFFGKKSYWFSIYVFSVWISLVYLGEHYAIDVLIGAIYALASFMIANRLPDLVKSLRPVKRRIIKWLKNKTAKASA